MQFGGSDRFKSTASVGPVFAAPKHISFIVMSTIGLILIIHAALMVLKYVYGNSYVGGMAGLFSLDAEANIPALAASLLIFFCGLAAFANGALLPNRKYDRRAWFYFGCLLLFLAVDEGARLHETVGEFTYNNVPSEWLPTSAFMLPYAVLGIVSGVILLAWYLKLERKTQVLFAIAGMIYLGGAAGVESATMAYFENRGLDIANNDTPIGDVLITIEETCEFLGMALLLHTLLIRLGGLRIGAGDEEHTDSTISDSMPGLTSAAAG